MNNDSVINKLYSEAVSQAELNMPEGDEYLKRLDSRTQWEKSLLRGMSFEQKTIFKSYKKSCEMLSACEEEETYRQGVSFGIRITAEAFLCGERKLKNG